MDRTNTFNFTHFVLQNDEINILHIIRTLKSHIYHYLSRIGRSRHAWIEKTPSTWCILFYKMMKSTFYIKFALWNPTSATIWVCWGLTLTIPNLTKSSLERLLSELRFYHGLIMAMQAKSKDLDRLQSIQFKAV